MVNVVNLRLFLTLNEAKAIIEVDNLVLVDGVASTTIKKNSNYLGSGINCHSTFIP